MATPPEAAEQQEKEALRSWSSTKYALSEGYPIPQWRRGLKWFLGNSPDKDFEGSLHGMLNIAYGAEEITAGPHEGEILIADRYQVLIVNRRLNCVFRHGSKNTIDIADGTQGFATFNHELGEEGRILWSMREGDRIQEIDVATGDVTLDWSINGPTATYEFAGGGRPPNPSFTGDIIVAERYNDRVRKYDRDQNVIEEVSVPSPDHATEIGGRGPKISIGHRDVALSTDADWNVLDFGDAWPIISSVNWYAGAQYTMTGSTTRGLVGTQDGMIALTPYLCERRLTLTPRMTALGTQHGTVQEFDLRTNRIQSVPMLRDIFRERTIDANTESDIRLVSLMGRSTARVFARSTEDANLHLYVPQSRSDKPQYVTVDTSTYWPVYREISPSPISITGGETVKHIVSEPAGFLGVSIEMGGTAGDVWLWTHVQ